MLIPCPACSRQVSTQALQCPGCGHPIADQLPAIDAREGAAQPQDGTDFVPPAAHLGADDAAHADRQSEGSEPHAAEARESPYSTSESPPEPIAPDAEVEATPPPTPPRPGRERAIDIPGSLPAAILILGFLVLELMGRALLKPGESSRPGPGCAALILGLGLLFGGPGFRGWGVFTHVMGLIILPLVMLSGAFGSVGIGDYLGVLANIGVIMLLSGEPSRNRVRWGITVSIAAFLISGAVSALFPVTAGRGGRELAATSFLQGLSAHEPQQVSLPAEFGGLKLTVPSELPELKPEAEDPGANAGGIEANTQFYGENGNRSVSVVAYRAAPGYQLNLNAAADGMMAAPPQGVTFRELSRAPDQVAGKPALRLIWELKAGDGSIAFARTHWVKNFPYAYSITLTDDDLDFLKGEAVRQLLLSVELPSK